MNNEMINEKVKEKQSCNAFFMLRNRKENNKTPDKTSKISYNFCASRQETVLIDIHRIYNNKHDEEQLKFSKINQGKRTSRVVLRTIRQSRLHTYGHP